MKRKRSFSSNKSVQSKIQLCNGRVLAIASATPSGVTCPICHVQLKSEQLLNIHLDNTHFTLSPNVRSTLPNAVQVTKKYSTDVTEQKVREVNAALLSAASRLRDCASHNGIMVKYPGQPIRPATIEECKDIPCDIIENYLPESLANNLLQESINSSQSWEASKWYMFDKLRTSNRASATFKVDSETVVNDENHPLSTCGVNDHTAKDIDDVPWKDDAEYTRTVRDGNACLNQAAVLIRKTVRERGAHRAGLGPDDSPYGAAMREFDIRNSTSWDPSFAFANCYKDGKEHLTFHGDHLTTIGPRAIIASLTVGAGRPFQWTRSDFLPKANSSASGGGRGATPKQQIDSRKDIQKQQQPVFSCVLKHNTLLIMWGPMQEEWKHAVPKARNESIVAHRVAGLKCFNYTFRCSREEFINAIPKCDCGRDACLRPSINRNSPSFGKYYYKCNPAGDNHCNYFVWAPWNDNFLSGKIISDGKNY